MGHSYHKSVGLFYVAITVSSSLLVLISEARLLKDDIVGVDPRNPMTKGVEILLDGFYIKTGGGPSAGGEGHAFRNNAATVGAKRNSAGPSPRGEGHALTDDSISHQTLEADDSAGPGVGGEAHAFPKAQTDRVTKQSGPAPGGEGH